MKEEMKSLKKNQTWELVQLATGKWALQNKWVYKLKEGEDRKRKHKSRLSVKILAQKKGVDFNESFAPVVKMNSIRAVLSLVATKDMHLEQMDVDIALLNGNLEEEIYMEQPQGHNVKGKEQMVCQLEKSLYVSIP
ncbi:hypothetical protein L7F22_055749 [Adiantum nelumboides]|nr:hypothetical protein [Adiantum nelumboides]